MNKQTKKIFIVSAQAKGFEQIIKILTSYGYVEGEDFFVVQGKKWTDTDDALLDLLGSHKRRSKPLEDRIENYKALGQNLEMEQKDAIRFYENIIIPKIKACEIIQNALQSGPVNEIEDVFSELEREKTEKDKIRSISEKIKDEITELRKEPTYKYEMDAIQNYPAPEIICIGMEGNLEEVVPEIITEQTPQGFIPVCGELIPDDNPQFTQNRVLQIIEEEKEKLLPDSIVRDEYLEQWYYGVPVSHSKLNPIVEDKLEAYYGKDLGANGIRREGELEDYYGIDIGKPGKIKEEEISL